MKLIARRTLEQARFFNSLAKEVEQSDLKKYEYFIEAAIVFGRSITFHIQKELKDCHGFTEWWEIKRNELSANQLCKYLLEKRNYILKEGAIKTNKNILIKILDPIFISDEIQIKVIRAKPWYKRNFKMIIEDFKRNLNQRLNELKRKSAIKLNNNINSKIYSHSYSHFDDIEFSNKPATDYIEEYLSVLEKLISEAENTFNI